MTLDEMNEYLNLDVEDYMELPKLITYVTRKISLLKLFETMSPNRTKHKDTLGRYIKVNEQLVRQYPEMYI